MYPVAIGTSRIDIYRGQYWYGYVYRYIWILLLVIRSMVLVLLYMGYYIYAMVQYSIYYNQGINTRYQDSYGYRVYRYWIRRY